MEPVQSSLKKWMRENEDFQQNYLKIKREVLQDPEITEFISHHPQLTQKEIDKNLIKLYEYKKQSKQCDKCTSVDRCINMLHGYSPIIQATDIELHIAFDRCHT